MTIATVAVVTSGCIITDQIRQQLQKSYSPVGQPAAYSFSVLTSDDCGGEWELLSHLRPHLVVLVSDEPNLRFEESVLATCRALSIPVLPVLGEGSVVLVGPLERPHYPGCVSCLRQRWENSVRRTRLRTALELQVKPLHPAHVTLSMTTDELSRLGDLVRGEIESVLKGGGDTVGHVALYRRNRQVRLVPLLPSHHCPRCAPLPDDCQELGSMDLKSQAAEDKEGLRARRVEPDDVLSLYVDRDLGYISEFGEECKEGFVRASAFIQTKSGQQIAGYGSAMASISARQTAVLEAIERSCSITAVNRRPVVYAPYDELRDRAVDPQHFGLHDDAIYTSHPFLKPYQPERPYSFIWAYSTRHKAPVLVPEQIAYFGPTRDTSRFVKESTSGCALGGSLEEAVLHGVFEVLERDGLLNMWYARMPVPELALGAGAPDDVDEIHRAIASKGYRVRFFNLSHDIGIPAIMAVAVNLRNVVPKVVSGSSCHIHPYQAVLGALRELFVQVQHMEGIPEDRQRQGLAMIADPAKIHGILDHVLASALPEAYGKWSFLLDNRDGQTIQSIDEAFSSARHRYRVDTGDIGTVLQVVLSDIHGLGFDVIVVNQTSVEAAAGGFHVVKALIPGMTPITFGHQSRRLKGLQRVFELPKRLGYQTRVLTVADLNPDCHPLA
jgi:ribosomal protein S12 methylthiotransferase accessory factor